MSEKKKLLIYAHYYVPDVASTGQILRELAEGMLEKFDVTVICVVPSYEGTISAEYKKEKYYRENISGVEVLRIRVPEFTKSNKMSRIKNILGYFFGAMSATFKVGRQDYVFSISQPPILGGLIGVWGKWVKRAKYIYSIQDFNPEQVMAVNYSKNKLVLKAMMWFDKFSCKRSDLVITVGRDLVKTMEKRFSGKKVPKTVMINNWIDEKEVYPLDKSNEGVAEFRKRYGLEDKYVIMYSGNIGLYYDLENLIKVMEKFPSGTRTKDGREVVFAFVGAGSVLGKLEAYKAEKQLDNVVFIPYQDKDKLIYSLNAADVHWCVNAKGIKGVSCPSKYYGIAATGIPVLAVLEKDSEIRLIIEETQGGLVSDPEDYDAVKKNIEWFIENAGSAEAEEMGRRGCENLVRNLTKDVSVEKYIDAVLNC
ncbi:MAG: glycosyltransferase family 4 protein [Oscillospiraceae bacterium]|nr:glycosyltransferase family 4 protein [Oscillospiraceae bacterium]